MILDVQGLFANRWLKLKFRIDEETIKNKINNDEEFDYDNLSDFRVNNTFEDNLELLKRFPDNIEMISGGRLDIIARTTPEVLFDLGDYRLEHDNLTLLERLIKVLGNIEQYPKQEEYIKMVISINNIGDALKILNHE